MTWAPTLRYDVANGAVVLLPVLKKESAHFASNPVLCLAVDGSAVA